MITGHASHQVGLDADIWLTPMPPRCESPTLCRPGNRRRTQR
jgi:penicillin-insensitive murein DD-endopeptidase